MSWYDSDWKFRIPMSVVNTAGAGTVEISAPFPKDYDLFWNNVRADGFDIRLTESDGITPISFAQGNALGWDFGAVPFSVATRTLTLRIDGWSGAFATVDACMQVFMYWGNAGAADARDGAVALGAPITGIFATRGARSFPKRVVTALESPGATTPTVRFQKTTTDIIEVAWDFAAELARRDQLYESHLDLEELQALEVDGGQGSTSIASIVDKTKTRFLKNNVVITHHKAGTNGGNYWLEAKATTSLGQRLTRRIEMRVKNMVQTT